MKEQKTQPGIDLSSQSPICRFVEQNFRCEYSSALGDSSENYDFQNQEIQEKGKDIIQDDIYKCIDQNEWNSDQKSQKEDSCLSSPNSNSYKLPSLQNNERNGSTSTSNVSLPFQDINPNVVQSPNRRVRRQKRIKRPYRKLKQLQQRNKRQKIGGSPYLKQDRQYHESEAEARKKNNVLATFKGYHFGHLKKEMGTTEWENLLAGNQKLKQINQNRFMTLEDFTFLYRIQNEMVQGHLQQFYNSRKLYECVRLGRANPNLKLFYIKQLIPVFEEGFKKKQLTSLKRMKTGPGGISLSELPTIPALQNRTVIC